MANLDFFAIREDLLSVLTFLYTETDCVVFESYSRYDQELRQFTSIAEIDAAHPIGEDPRGNGVAILLQLHSPSVARPPRIKRIGLKLPGHSFRYCVESAGLMQLYLGGICDCFITQSHFGHWNETGARQRCIFPADEVDWARQRSLSGKIQRHIKNHLSQAKTQARYVLFHAFSAMQVGKIARVGSLSFGVTHPDLKQLSPKGRPC
jgi:hypothetical protein